MLLLDDIAQQVKPLSLQEKSQLIQDIQKMIEEETLRQFVRSDVVYDIDTPCIGTSHEELP